MGKKAKQKQAQLQKQKQQQQKQKHKQKGPSAKQQKAAKKWRRRGWAATRRKRIADRDWERLWSKEKQRKLFPFELQWECLSGKERKAFLSLSASRDHLHASQEWSTFAVRRAVGDPLNHSLGNMWRNAPDSKAEKSLLCMCTLGLLWKGADVAGFGMLHSAFRAALASVRLSSSCEVSDHWMMFTLRGGARGDPRAVLRASVNAEDCSLRYWDILCPQVAKWGFCEAERDCPFALNDEELARHPAIFNANTSRRSIAKGLSFETRFGKDALKVVNNPSCWACNLGWWKHSVVTGVHAFAHAPLVELEVSHGTLGPGRCGPTELRYLILSEPLALDKAIAGIACQMPRGNSFETPLDFRWLCGRRHLAAIKYRIKGWCDRQQRITSSSSGSSACICLEALPSLVSFKLFCFLGWLEVSALQVCCSQFVRFTLCWRDGSWCRERAARCPTSAMLAAALQSRRGLKERGGSWSGRQQRELGRKRRRSEAAGAEAEGRAGCGLENAAASADDLDIARLQGSMDSLDLEVKTLHAIATDISKALHMPLLLDSACPDAFSLWKIGTMLERAWSWNIIQASEPFRRHLVRVGFGKALHMLMQFLLRLPVEDAEVAMEVVLRVLSAVSFVHSRRPRRGPRMLLQPSLAVTVLAVLRQFADNELVVARGLRLVASLVYNCDSSKRVMEKFGGIDRIVAAMVAHEDVDSVFSAGMSALVNFTFPHGEGRSAERALAYVTPHAGRVHSLCSQIFAHAEVASPDAVQEVSMGCAFGGKFKSKLDLSLIKSCPQGEALDDSEEKLPVRHLYLTATGATDSSELRRGIEQAVVDNIGHRSLPKYEAVMFYSSSWEYRKFRSSLKGISPELAAVHSCFVPPGAKIDKASLEFWFFWVGFGAPADAPPRMSHELSCDVVPRIWSSRPRDSEGALSQPQCLEVVRRVAFLLRTLKEIAQAHAGLGDKGWEDGNELEQLSSRLQDATAECQLCRQDLVPILDILQSSPGPEMWSKLLYELNPRSVDVSISDLRYLQDSISSCFLHGPHAGQPIEQLVLDLHSGKTSPSNLALEVVRWHGHYRTLGHRRVWALKTWLQEAQLRASGSAWQETKVRATFLPLVGKVTDATGRSALGRFSRSCSTENDGVRVRVGRRRQG